MTPIELRITNFRSVRGTQVFRFSRAPGLHFVQGVNEAEPRLGANGAGKSTIWDALCWLFFERTPRGLKAGDVNNWDAGKDTRVELDFDMGASEGKDWNACVRRNWKPNRWELLDRDTGEVFDLTKEADNPVLTGARGLRLGLQPFLGCVLMAQGQGMFLDMKPGPQAELFGELMGLDRWLDLSERASRRVQREDLRLRNLERDLHRAEGRMDALDPDALRAKAAEWEKDRAARVDRLEVQWANFDEFAFGKEDLAFAEKSAETARAALVEAKVPASLMRKVEDADAAHRELDRTLAVLEAQENDAGDQLQRAERKEDCRECGQSLGTPAHHRAARAKFDRVSQQASDVAARMADVALELKRLREDLKKAEDREDAARRALRDAEQDLTKARRDKEQEDREWDRVEDELDAAQKEQNPHALAADRADGERRSLEAEIRELRRALDDAERQRSLAAYWVRGFKEVRLALIAEALTELEVEVNSCCADLGLPDWELRFQVDRETKGGGVSRGFSVLVRAPGSPDLVPWEAWSGGEGQRLRIAAQMGLADLIRARTGATFPVEVWDEPTSGLSPEGVDDLLRALERRARVEGRTIYLVDHRTYAFGGFAGSTTVTKKTAEGSLIEQEGV